MIKYAFCLLIGHIYIQGLQTQYMSRCHNIRLDCHIQQCDVLCLTETHCKPCNSVSIHDIWVDLGGHVYRCDKCGKG